MDVTALPDASLRTKNRVTLLTPYHEIISWSTRSSVAEDGRAVYLRVPNDFFGDWYGWLPWSEITVEGVEFGDAF
jgi:hypothetical protein